MGISAPSWAVGDWPVRSVWDGRTGVGRPDLLSSHEDFVYGDKRCGGSDPGIHSIPLHLAVNGSLEVGHTVGIVLAGDATGLVKAAVREQLEGVGVPSVRDLLAKVRQHEVPVFV